MGTWTWTITSFGWYNGTREGFAGRAAVFCRRGCWCADVEIWSKCGEKCVVDRVYFSEDHESAEHAREMASRAADRAIRRRFGLSCEDDLVAVVCPSDRGVMQ